MKSRAELEAELAYAFQGILGSGVTPGALHNPSRMTYDDIHANQHLYERLGTAMAALGALRGYRDLPRGFTVREGS